MQDKRVRPGVWAAVLGLLALAAVVVFFAQSPRPPRPEGASLPQTADSVATPASSPHAGTRPRESRGAGPAAAATQEPVPYIEGLVFGDIDLREAKAAMPDNLYWELGSPTKDPAVLERREADKARLNEQYGKVLAGDASEDEVRAYYDYRRRLSSDFLEFAEFMSRRFRGSLSDEFQGLLDLSIQLHSARLAQMAEELEDALARSREHEKIREDWREQQEEFGEVPPPSNDNR